MIFNFVKTVGILFNANQTIHQRKRLSYSRKSNNQRGGLASQVLVSEPCKPEQAKTLATELTVLCTNRKTHRQKRGPARRISSMITSTHAGHAHPFFCQYFNGKTKETDGREIDRRTDGMGDPLWTLYGQFELFKNFKMKN